MTGFCALVRTGEGGKGEKETYMGWRRDAFLQDNLPSGEEQLLTLHPHPGITPQLQSQKHPQHKQ